MTRNLERRVEAMVPVTDPRLQKRLAEILTIDLADDTLAWELTTEGTWRKLPTIEGISAHRRLQEAALARTHAS